MPEMADASPPLFLYVRQGCHLCEETRVLLDALLDDRRERGLRVPIVEERDIETNEAWHRAFLTTIPVVELGGHRLELATSAGKLRRLLADALDAQSAASIEA